MSDKDDANAVLVVVVNGEPQLHYDRRKNLPEPQHRYLRRMDEQMDAGVHLGGQWLENPDALQRAQFVAVHLIEAMQSDQEDVIAASCAYLASRLPDLKQVKAKLAGTGFAVELVFDKPHVSETAVTFMPRPNA
jgi:hypothetical protein